MIVSYENMHVSLGGKKILNGVNLETAEGKMTGVIGPNGCGKSTLIRTTFGICSYTEGTIRIDGTETKRFTPKKLASMIGYVGQNTVCAFDFTVFDVVAMGYYAREDKTVSMKEAVEQALEELQIQNLRDRSILSLSGGEQKMVFIARTLVQNADLLILDEPTNHLDIRHQLFLLDYLKQCGKTTLIVLHDLRLASHYCDEIFLMNAGTITASGTPMEVLNYENVAQVFGIDGSAWTNENGSRDFAMFGNREKSKIK